MGKHAFWIAGIIGLLGCSGPAFRSSSLELNVPLGAEGGADDAQASDGAPMVVDDGGGAEASAPSDAALRDLGSDPPDAGVVPDGPNPVDSPPGDGGWPGDAAGDDSAHDACGPTVLTHANGEGQTYASCDALGTDNQSDAMLACAPLVAILGGSCVVGACGGGTSIVMAEGVTGECIAWAFAGPNAGHTKDDSGDCTMVCPSASDPTWN